MRIYITKELSKHSAAPKTKVGVGLHLHEQVSMGLMDAGGQNILGLPVMWVKVGGPTFVHTIEHFTYS